MFFEPYIIIVILLATMGLFIWGKWRYDVVALIALAISILVGAVPFDHAYKGLSNPAVITVAMVMVISKAITESGILSALVTQSKRWTKNLTLHVTLLTLFTAIISAFMNNVGALALMMPIALQTAYERKRSPSLLLMPIAIGSALGGLTTVIGTPPNLLVSAYRQKVLGQPFSMFDFSHVGLLTAVAGVIFISIFGWRLMPSKRKTPKLLQDDIFQISDYITEIVIPETSPLVDQTVADLESLTKGDFLIIGMIRKGRKKWVLQKTQPLRANDILIIEAAPDDLGELIREGELELVHDKAISSEELRSDDVGLIEAVIPQASRVEGRSSESLRLRSRFRMNLLAIAREGKALRKRLHQTSLHAGDVVLLQGSKETLRETTLTLGLLPIVERSLNIGRKPRAYIPLALFIVAIVLAALQVLPVEIAFGGAVLGMVLLNAINIRTVYESVDWPILILLAAMIPIGNALQSTGGTQLITQHLLAISGHASPIIALVLLLIITMTLSDFMNNAATTVVMAPIAVSLAHALTVNIDPYLMAVAVGASCSFLTPVGHQNNTLVMGPGGYKFSDYIRLGLPVELIVLAISIPMILWAWPLQLIAR